MWDLPNVGKIIRMLLHLVRLPARVGQVPSVPSLVLSIFVTPRLRAMILTLTSAVQLGITLHPTVSFPAKVVWTVNAPTAPSASLTLHVTTTTRSCVEIALKTLVLA